MKALFTFLLLISTAVSFGNELTHEELVSLYTEGKLEERDFFDLSLGRDNKTALLQKMKEAAQHVSVVWADTILEGSYEQLEEARLNPNEITALFHDNLLVGFTAYVLAEGAYTGECSYDEEDYKECLDLFKGNIYEMFLLDKNGDLVDGFHGEVDFDN